MTVYVGIDWGKRKSQVFYGAAEGKTGRATLGIGYAPVEALAMRLKREYGDATEFVVMLEAGAPVLAEVCHHLGMVVYVVDGKQAKNFASSLKSSKAKSDKADAKGIWKMAQSAAHRRERFSPSSGQFQAIERTLRHLDQLIEDRIRTTNRLRAALQREVSALEAVMANFKSQYVRDLAVLVPTAWHASQLTLADWDAFLSSHPVPHAKRSDLWAGIQDAARLVLDDQGSAEVKAAVIGHQVELLSLLLTQEAMAQAQLETLANEHESVVCQSLKGVAGKTNAQVLVHLFPNGPGKDRDEGAKRGSAAPVRIQTGSTVDIVCFRRSTKPLARAATYRLGLQAIMHIPWATAMYEWSKERGTKPSTAIRKVARSLLRIIRAMLKSGEEYDNERYLAILKKKGLPWALPL